MDQPWIHPGSCERACRQPSAPSIECARTRAQISVNAPELQWLSSEIGRSPRRPSPLEARPDGTCQILGLQSHCPVCCISHQKVNPGLILHTVNPSVVKLTMSAIKHFFTLAQCWINVGPPSSTLAQHYTSIVSMPSLCWLDPPIIDGTASDSDPKCELYVYEFYKKKVRISLWFITHPHQ